MLLVKNAEVYAPEYLGKKDVLICGGKIEKDGFVYIFCFPEYYSPHSQYIEDFYKNILEEDINDLVYSGNFKVISHSYSNEEIGRAHV